jgi:hypothetical protein
MGKKGVFLYLKVLFSIPKGLYISILKKINKLGGYGWMKYKILLVLVIFFCIPVVCALEDFSISYESIKSRIYPNETANYDLRIRNNLGYDARYQIYSGAIEWDVTTEPSSDRNRLIPAMSTVKIRVLVNPTKKDFFPNLYGVPIRIKNLETEEVKTPEFILEIRGNVTQIGGDYLPAVRASLDVKKEVDPREGIPIKVTLQNQNRLNISNVLLVLSAGLFKKEYETNLEGLEKKNLNFVIPLDPYLIPQKDTLRIDVYIQHNETQYSFMAEPLTYDIISYGDIQKTIDEKKTFLKKKSRVVLSNTGNIGRDYKYEIRKTLFSPLFLKAEPAPIVRNIDGIDYYVWNGNLQPKESHSFTIYVSYRWLFFIMLLIVIGIAVYYFTRSPVSITKSAVVTRKSEGGASQLTIQLHIKNRVAKKFYALEIRDKVPNLLIVKNDFELGTVQPSSILKHSKRGTIIKWNIEEIDPFEERIISYKTAAKLSILGEFSLPKTVLKYKKDIADDYKYVHSEVFKMDYS